MSESLKDWAERTATSMTEEVVRFPCKVGATVYMVVRDKRVKQPLACEVVGFWYSKDPSCSAAHMVHYKDGIFDSSFSIPLTEFGRTVFLMKDEAEEMIAKRKADKVVLQGESK